MKQKITYPRKCNHCGYLANNPAMYHYHVQTHAPIAEGTKCDHGCGQPAICRSTGGKYSCTKISQQCPEYVKKHSARIKEHWERPNAIQRKEDTAQSLIDRLHNQSTVDKMIKTKREKFGTFTPELVKDFRHYARFVRQRAQRWAVSCGHILGKQTYHVDHRFSVLDAWKNNIPEHIVNHPANLQILEAKVNSSKGSTSELTLDELYDMIEKYNKGIT